MAVLAVIVTSKGSGARQDSTCWSRAQLPQSSTGMIGAGLDDRLVGGPSKAQELRAQEQSSTVPTGAGLNGPWSKARQG